MPSLSPRAPRAWLLCLAIPLSAAAQAPRCDGPLSRDRLIACALTHSPAVAAQRGELTSAEGRLEGARPFLPSNPVLSGSVGARSTAGARATNWSVMLAQELEVAGQSGLRVDVAGDELQASQASLEVVRADIAEQAWRAWFEALAARERVQLALTAERASLEVAKTTSAMLATGLSSEVDAAVAEAAAAAATRRRLDAERTLTASEVQLRALLDAPGVEWTGALEPLRWSGADIERPEARVLQRLSSAARRRTELLRRSRVPNPTLSVQVQNDGFDERVVGVGLGIPVPLPQPLGRTNAGPIAESVGVEARLVAELERLSRQLDAERRLARSDFEQWKTARALYTPSRIAQATRGLEAIAEQLRAARLSVREALTSQHALVEFLDAEVEARAQLCLASIRLVRTHGGSLEGDDL